ncbi:MAG: trypsin-like peptidase domain-containing protein [Planctomycetia bacterium]|nr:trypsin-like peptidase domain-containing protein [Planctomycetia bacterium]
MRFSLSLAVLSVLASSVTSPGAANDDVLKAEAERVAVVARAREAAVAIFAAGGQGGGSGVVITPDGYALSNFHVTKGAGDAMKCGMADGRMYDAVIVGIDPVGDVALLKLLGRDDFPHAVLGDSDQVQAGDWAFAVGNPFLLATDFTPSVSYGIISGVHRYQYPAGTLLEYTDCIQTDASINPGNSGGPLFDSQGRLIGINGRGSFEKRGRVNVGVGYAISINQIKNFLGHLKAGRVVDHATLGARVASQADGRVTVADILDDSDAFRRGLRPGDEIVRFGGRVIRTVNAFKNVLGIFPRDWRVMLTYRREGQTYDVPVRLEGVHSPEELISKVQGRAPAEPVPDEPMPEKREPGQRRPRDGGPRPTPALARREPMPAEVKAVYETRRGYANYYFNKLERSRVWNHCIARGDFHEATGEWLLRGELAGGGDAEFRLSDVAAGCTLPGGHMRVPITEDLTSASDPPGSGGMLAALELWRRLVVLGPEKFGDMYYLGTAPLAGPHAAADVPALFRVLGHDRAPAAASHGELCDVLAGTFAGVECRFMFDPKSGNLVAMEMYRSDNDDPCELYFADYAELEGRVFPRRIEVRYGDAVYLAVKLVEVKLDKMGDK